MTWFSTSWDRHLRIVRSALHKRDVLLAGGCRPDRGASQGNRECRAWAAKARANLSQLTRLASSAPDPEAAWAIVQGLRCWHQQPGRPPDTEPDQKVDPDTRICDYHG
jgi:hypothetical protein